MTSILETCGIWDTDYNSDNWEHLQLLRCLFWYLVCIIASKDNSIGLCQTLENSNQLPVLVLDVIINGDDEHEDKEDPSPAKKVPDVMPEEKNSFIRFCARKKNLHIFPSR